MYNENKHSPGIDHYVNMRRFCYFLLYYLKGDKGKAYVKNALSHIISMFILFTWDVHDLKIQMNKSFNDSWLTLLIDKWLNN